MSSWCLVIAYLSAISYPGILACPEIQQNSTVFPVFCKFATMCSSFCTFGLVGICFWSAYRQLLEFVNIEMLFIFLADIVFRARCILRVSAVNIEINFDSDIKPVMFPVVAAAPTPIYLLESSVNMCFYPLYILSMTSLNLFW